MTTPGAPVHPPSPDHTKRTLCAWEGEAGTPGERSASFTTPDQGNGGAWTLPTIRWKVVSASASSPEWAIEMIDEVTGARYGLGGGGNGSGHVDLGGFPTGRTFHLVVSGDGSAMVKVQVEG